ncbi:MAG: hypothetical protein ACRD9S_19585 [Pyrinomonadaceae bacterium]
MSRLLFEPNPKHHGKKRGRISAQPTNGQEVLDTSVQIRKESPRRLGVDVMNREIVIFMQHLPDVFHGFVVDWTDLEPRAQKILQDLGLVNRRGRILQAKR